MDWIGHVRYINILTWLWGFQVKPLYLMLFSLYLSLFWELRDKGNLKNLQFWPKSLGAMLEYWYIERGLLVDHQSINQSINQSVSQSISYQQNTMYMCFAKIFATVQMEGEFEKEVSKVYSLCILDFVIYNQLNEVYNLQISTRYCRVIRPRNEQNNNVNTKLEINIY